MILGGFMRLNLIAVATSTLVLLSCTATDQRIPVGDTTEAPYFASFTEGRAEAAKLNRSMLVDFYTDW